MKLRFPDARILIFAKVPEPGRVKTRLVPPLTPRAAADLHRRLLTETVARLVGAGVAPVELWCTPHAGAPFPDLARSYGATLHVQQGHDLGERMRCAADEALRRAGAVVLVGTDCPGLDGDYVAAGLRALAGSDAVLGPADDGGYVLLGLRQSCPEVFSGIPWGTDRVAAFTRDRMTSAGRKWRELESLWDLDRPADLARYRAGLNAGG